MLDPHIQPKPQAPLLNGLPPAPARPLLLARWVEDAFEVQILPGSKARTPRARTRVSPSRPR